MNVRSVSDLERGGRRRPYRETVAHLAEALELDDAARQALSDAATRRRAPAAHDLVEAHGVLDRPPADPLLETKLAVLPWWPVPICSRADTALHAERRTVTVESAETAGHRDTVIASPS